MKNIEKSIGQYFNGHRNSHISSLLDFIAKTYELDILNNSDKGQLYSYDIRGEHNYEIISRTIFTLIRMEQENIISYHKQEGGVPTLKIYRTIMEQILIVQRYLEIWRNISIVTCHHQSMLTRAFPISQNMVLCL